MTTYHSVEAKMLPLAVSADDFPRRFTDALNVTPGWRTDVPRLTWQYSKPVAPDWISTIDRTRVVSTRTGATLEPLLALRDAVQWLPARLTTPQGEPLAYWVMHFPETFDPYDEAATVRGPSGIPIPGGGVISLRRVEGHQIFAPPRQSSDVFVSAHVLAKIREAGLTGWRAEAFPTA